MKRSFTLLFGTFLALNSLGQPHTQTFSKEQIKADISYLVSSVEETLVDPYARMTKSQFRKEINKASQQLLSKGNVSIIDMYQHLQPALVHLKDGHTDIYINSYLDSTNYWIFPFKMAISQHGLIVTGIESEYDASVSTTLCQCGSI